MPGSSTEPKSLSKDLSGAYVCDDEACGFTVGMVLPDCEFAKQKAMNQMALAEKVAIALSSKMSHLEKEEAFEKADDCLTRQEKIPISGEINEIAWKVALQSCKHQAQKFKEMLGKSLDGYEMEDEDLVRRMIARLNTAHYMPIMKNISIVVCGYKNAERLKNAIGTAYYAIQNGDDSTIRSRVIFGAKAKLVIYVPTESLLFAPGTNFESAAKIMINTLNNLEACNKCDLIMLPILRHVKHPERSKEFYNWYKKTAEKDNRLIGMQEVDEMKLIHWLHATPNNASATEYVDENGLLTEMGTKTMVDYLNSIGYKLKHRILAEKEVHPLKTMEEPEALGKEIDRESNQNRSGSRNRGNFSNRGMPSTRGNFSNRGYYDRNRGFKRRSNEDGPQYG